MCADRPPISVIVPFAGSPSAGDALVSRLRGLDTRPGDELVVVDNTIPPSVPLATAGEVTVLRAPEQASSYYARNVGAERARNDWLLFIDADCVPPVDLLERYFREPPGAGCGAVAGQVVGRAAQSAVISRYTRARGLLDQQSSAARGEWAFGRTANLLVRREAFDQLGGFCEGIRSAGDADFCRRLLELGWTLEFKRGAIVEHDDRETVYGLACQIARYAASSAWMVRRHGAVPSLAPQTGAMGKVYAAGELLRAAIALEREAVVFRTLDALLLVTRRVARHLPNAAPGSSRTRRRSGRVSYCARVFPVDDEALDTVRSAEFGGGRVEAGARPLRLRTPEVRGLDVAYREDDADVTRWRAAARLLVGHPRRSLCFLMARAPEGRPLARLLELAPPARRVAASGADEVRPLDDVSVGAARQLAQLAGARSLAGSVRSR